MHTFDPLQNERMSGDEAQRVAQLLSERLRDSISVEELAATMNLPRDQVAAALTHVRRQSASRPQAHSRFDTRYLIAAIVGVVLVWSLFLVGLFVSTSVVRPPSAPPAPEKLVRVVPEVPAPVDAAPEIAPEPPAPSP